MILLCRTTPCRLAHEKHYYNNELIEYCTDNGIDVPETHEFMNSNLQFLRNDNVKWSNSRPFLPLTLNWELAKRAYTSIWEPVFADCDPISLEDSVQIAEKKSNSGLRFIEQFGCATKGEVYEKHLALIKSDITKISNGEDVQMALTMASKLEMRPIEKFIDPDLEKRKQRSFTMTDALHYIVGIMLFETQNAKINKQWDDPSSMVAAGMTMFHGGWDIVARNLLGNADFRKQLFCCKDVSAMEASVVVQFQEVMYSVRRTSFNTARRYPHLPKWERSLNYKKLFDWWFFCLLYAPTIDFDGFVWIRCGMNPSGQNLTLYDNIQCLILVYLYALSFSVVSVPALISEYRNSRVKLMGDDSIYPVNSKLLELDRHALQIGFVMTDEIPEPVILLKTKFCGFRFRYDYERNQFTYECDFDKVLSSVLKHMVKNSWRFTFVKLCAARLLTYCNKHQFDIINRLTSRVYDKYGPLMAAETQHDKILSLHACLSQYLSENELGSIVYGTENSTFGSKLNHDAKSVLFGATLVCNQCKMPTAIKRNNVKKALANAKRSIANKVVSAERKLVAKATGLRGSGRYRTKGFFDDVGNAVSSAANFISKPFRDNKSSGLVNSVARGAADKLVNSVLPGLGKYAGNAASWLTNLVGFGKYGVKRNTLMRGDTSSGFLTQPMPTFGGNSSQRRIKACVYIEDVLSATGFNPTSYYLNPQNGSFGQWIIPQALGYEKWALHGCIFYYKECSATAWSGTTPGLGTVTIASEYDCNNSFHTQADMDQATFSVKAVPYQNAAHPVECDRRTASNTIMYMTTAVNPLALEGLSPGVSCHEYFHCNTTVATNGNPSSGPKIGELWCDFDLEFFNPKITQAGVIANYQHVFGNMNHANTVVFTGNTSVGYTMSVTDAANILNIGNSTTSPAPGNFHYQLRQFSTNGSWGTPTYSQAPTLIGASAFTADLHYNGGAGVSDYTQGFSPSSSPPYGDSSGTVTITNSGVVGSGVSLALLDPGATYTTYWDLKITWQNTTVSSARQVMNDRVAELESKLAELYERLSDKVARDERLETLASKVQTIEREDEAAGAAAGVAPIHLTCDEDHDDHDWQPTLERAPIVHVDTPCVSENPRSRGFEFVSRVTETLGISAPLQPSDKKISSRSQSNK